MKILFIEPCHVGFGGYFRAYNICTSLGNRGIKTDMLCAAENKFQLFVKKTNIGLNCRRFELPRFYFHFFFNGRLLRALIGFFFGLTGKYDIIHAAVPVQLESSIPAYLLKKLGKKVVIDWDDWWEVSTIYGEYKIMKKYVEYCEHKAPAFFNNFVVVSDLLAEQARKNGAKNVIKIINGVNEKQFEPHSRSEALEKLRLDKNYRYILTFGNTYINERAYMLLKTFEYICSKTTDVKLIINQDPKRILAGHKLANQIDSKIFGRIINVGQIPQKDLGYYLGVAEATLFLMGDAENERACFPIRIGSYLNGGAVIITNDNDSEATNTLKRYDCAILDKDMHSLAEKTFRFLNDTKEQSRLRNNVAGAKSALSWDKLINPLVDYYKHILKNS